MKKFILSLCCSLISILSSNAQRHSHGYDVIGLSDSEEVGNALLIGIPLLIILYLIVKNAKNSKSDGERSPFVGCLFPIILIIAIFVLTPVFVWLEFAVGIIVGIVSIVAIIMLIYTAIFKREE